jgi:signal transduction histidine kinase
VVVLAVVYAAFTVSLLRRETGLAEDRLRQTARLVAAELDTYLDTGLQRLALVSQLPGMTHGLRVMQEAPAEGRIPPWTTLHYLFFKSSVFTGGVFLLDRNGKVLWTEPPGQTWVGRQLGDHPALARARDQHTGIISPGLDAGDLLDRPHVILAVPVRNPDGKTDGLLVGVIDLSAHDFTKMLGAVATTEGRFVEVIDQRGRIIAASDTTRTFQSLDSAEATGKDSDDWTVAPVRMTHAPWRVIAGQPRALALAQVWQVQRELLILGVGLLLAALMVGAPIVNRFVRDIRRLTDAAETMARGDLSRPVQVSQQGDEIATLANTLEQMRIEVESARVALEHRLEEREELFRLKEQFLASISHELRTPLNAIIGYTDMLTDQLDLDHESRSFLANIRQQSEHLHEMLTDLLTLSNLNVGHLAMERSPVHIPALLAHLEPHVMGLCKDKDITVVWDCSHPLPIMETDALRLQQVLTNLVTNAIKFTERGQVTVRVRYESNPERIVFSVTDTGVGIPESELPHIFDEFRQVDGSSTRVHGGVGLGLALVKHLTQLLQGDVAVQSRVGAGSTFIVRLPVHLESGSPARSAA